MFIPLSLVVVIAVCPSVVSDSLGFHGLQPSRRSVHGILQARILEWIAIPFPEDLPDPGIEPWSAASQVDSLPFELQESPKFI